MSMVCPGLASKWKPVAMKVAMGQLQSLVVRGSVDLEDT
jgi:hypothetical protein